MGIYDRDYQRDYNPPGGFNLGGTTTLTTKLVLVMVAIYFVQLATRGPMPPADGRFTDLFSLHADVVKRPWLIFQFLTYGFLHDPWSIQHILFNMVGFWLFGRMIEYRYGQREYLSFFLVAIVVSGVVWVLGEFVANRQLVQNVQILGASGGIAAVLLLFCLNYPRQIIYIWAVLPVPAWVFAIFFVGMDLMGASGRPLAGDANVAFTAHLGGALFAILYYQAGWRLERLVPRNFSLESLRPKPRLRVVDPDSPEPSTDERVDEILQKIQEQGRNSLTGEERRILEEASQKYQRRRR
jgi:membrane associated rhomboid family serine protease